MITGERSIFIIFTIINQPMRYFTLFLILVLCLSSCDSDKIKTDRITKIGYELTSTEDYKLKDVVIVGEGLKEEMKKLRSSYSDFDYKIKRGDLEFDWIDNKADVVLRIGKEFDYIDIRLKYYAELDKYHILGWVSEISNQYSVFSIQHSKLIIDN